MKIGNLVYCDGEYAVTKECIHGNLYYAYIGSEDDAIKQDYKTKELDKAEVISRDEWEKDRISHCCG